MLYVNYRFINNNEVTTPINSEMVLLLFNNNLLFILLLFLRLQIIMNYLFHITHGLVIT